MSVYAELGGQQAKATLASPTDLGAPLVFLSKSATDSWVEVYLPLRPNGSTGWIRRSDVVLEITPYYVRVELSATRITVWQNSQLLLREPAAVGSPQEPTPTGLFYIAAGFQPSGPAGTVDQCVELSSFEFVFILSGFHLTPPACAYPQVGVSNIENRSGSARFDAQLGTQTTHGGVRISTAALKELAKTLPLGTPFEIVP